MFRIRWATHCSRDEYVEALAWQMSYGKYFQIPGRYLYFLTQGDDNGFTFEVARKKVVWWVVE
jgi:hypothetical protein